MGLGKKKKPPRVRPSANKTEDNWASYKEGARRVAGWYLKDRGPQVGSPLTLSQYLCSRMRLVGEGLRTSIPSSDADPRVLGWTLSHAYLGHLVHDNTHHHVHHQGLTSSN